VACPLRGDNATPLSAGRIDAGDGAGTTADSTSGIVAESGVGGTVSNEDVGKGLRVGEVIDVMPSIVRVILCDLGGGGGPGGGGGKGMPGCHLVVDGSRECAGEFVLIAPVEAARREPGGCMLIGGGCSSAGRIGSIVRLGMGGTGGTGSLFTGGDILGFSALFVDLLEKLNMPWGRSLDPALDRPPGGGG
jgi:hypothetical protein